MLVSLFGQTMFPDIAYAPLDMLRKVKWNFRLCLLIVLVVDVSFPMVIPSLWPYLDSLGVSQKYLGWYVAICGDPLPYSPPIASQASRSVQSWKSDWISGSCLVGSKKKL